VSKTYQVVGIGNAVVDVLTTCDDSFLDHMGIEKGIMQLIEKDRAETLYAAMKERTQQSGGSVANTVAGCGSAGLTTAFIGRVKNDALGNFYAQDMADDGGAFVNAPVAGGDLPTSRCMIFVTPDGERSMNTYLGISTDVGPDDVDESVCEAAEILFLEGYLYDKPAGKEAFQKAARATRRGGGKSGIALSDPFCVNRHRADFQRLVAEDLDYVIGNVHEFEALYETDLETALATASAACDLVVCTRSGDPVVIIGGGDRVEVPVHTVVPVDATGAGDQFAAGFLSGLAQGKDLSTCGKMGCIAAAEVISHMGARPEQPFEGLFARAGL
jgi:sugar/nucleoside kinase (ribokinase family)